MARAVDPGLVRAVKKQSGAVAGEELGALFEGWVATLLRLYGEVRELWDEMYYWARAESRHTEVDFLLKRGREFLAIEVKAGSQVSSQALAGLKAIADLQGARRRILIAMVRRRMKTADGIEIWPIETFLDALASSSLWP